MCLLEGGLSGSCIAQHLDGCLVLITLFVEPCKLDEQRKVELAQILAPAFGPLLVAVLGQEVSGVEVDGCPVGSGSRSGWR